MTVTQSCLASVFAVFALVACASGGEDAASATGDPTTGQAKLQAPLACDLRRTGVGFTALACESCMQQKCCAPTAACFSANADCAALHACLVKCPIDHPISIPGSPQGAGAPVDAKTQREVENPCAAACEEAHAPSVELHGTYDTCIRTQCMPACAG